MNAPNETSRQKPPALPDAWVARIFGHMEALYGSVFLDRWKHSDMDRVRHVWAEELAGFRDQPEMIGHALKSLNGKPMPPTLPEFLDLCRHAPRPERLAIEGPKLSPDEQRARAAEIGKIAQRSPGFDFLAWARNPGTEYAMRAVVECATKGDERFVEILADLKARGVCDEAGRLKRKAV